MPTSLDEFHSEHNTPGASELTECTASPAWVGANVVAWLAGARLDLSRPAMFGVTLVGAFALGVILVTIALAVVPSPR